MEDVIFMEYEYWEAASHVEEQMRVAIFNDLNRHRNKKERCDNRSPNGIWSCSRPKEHRGPHEGGWRCDNKNKWSTCGLWKNENDNELWDELPVITQVKLLKEKLY